MKRSSWLVFLLAGAVWALPQAALAKDAVVTPLLSKGVDPMIVLNLTSLIASELDFQGSFDEVTQLDKTPAGMTNACLTSASCLKGIATANKANVLVGGTVSLVSKRYEFNLVYFDADASKIARTKTFALPNVPSVIADSMGGYVKELMSGKSQASVAAESSMGDMDGMSTLNVLEEEEEEDIGPVKVPEDSANRRIATPSGSGRALSDEFGDLSEEEDEEEVAAAAAAKARADADAKARADAAAAKARAEADAKARADAAAAKARADAEARARAEQAAREEEERARAEVAAAQARVEAAARAREEAEAARRRSAPAPAEEEEEIQFGRPDAGSIQVEDVQIGSAAGLIVMEDEDAEEPEVAEEEIPAPRRSSAADLEEELEPSRVSPRARAAAPSDDEEEDELDTRSGSSRSSSSRTTPSRTSSARSANDEEDEEVASSRGATSRESTSRSSRSSTPRDEEEEEVLDEKPRRERSLEDLEEDEGRTRASRAPKSSTSKATTSKGGKGGKADVADSRVMVAVRAGYASFQSLGFITYGGEVALLPSTHLAIVAGMEAYSVKRTVPEALRASDTPPEIWNSILPVHLGAQARLGSHKFRPYVGADLQFIPSYVKKSDDGSGGGTAIGGRARGGTDFLISDSFGLNLNVSVGGWSGANFASVESGMKSSGLVPQISAGTVLRF